jgi:hypothetical protein
MVVEVKSQIKVWVPRLLPNLHVRDDDGRERIDGVEDGSLQVNVLGPPFQGNEKS